MLEPLSLTIDQITETDVFAKTNDGTAFRLPKSAIHGTPVVGQTIRLIGVVPGSENAGQTAFAHTLLQELLGK